MTRITIQYKYQNFPLHCPVILYFSHIINFQPNVREDPVQLVKLENILSLALHLREVAEDFQKKKVRDILDFEWVRNPRWTATVL